MNTALPPEYATRDQEAIDEAVHEVLEAARRQVQHTDRGYLPVQRWADELRDAVERLDALTMPDPWALLREMEPHVPTGCIGLHNRVTAALGWHEDRVLR